MNRSDVLGRSRAVLVLPADSPCATVPKGRGGFRRNGRGCVIMGWQQIQGRERQFQQQGITTSALCMGGKGRWPTAACITVTGRGCAGPPSHEAEHILPFSHCGHHCGAPLWHKEPCSHAVVPALGFTSPNTRSPLVVASSCQNTFTAFPCRAQVSLAAI